MEWWHNSIFTGIFSCNTADMISACNWLWINWDSMKSQTPQKWLTTQDRCCHWSLTPSNARNMGSSLTKTTNVTDFLTEPVKLEIQSELITWLEKFGSKEANQIAKTVVTAWKRQSCLCIFWNTRCFFGCVWLRVCVCYLSLRFLHLANTYTRTHTHTHSTTRTSAVALEAANNRPANDNFLRLLTAPHANILHLNKPITHSKNTGKLIYTDTHAHTDTHTHTRIINRKAVQSISP